MNLVLSILFFCAATASAGTALFWSVPPGYADTNLFVRVYSTTNLAFTAKEKQDALLRLVRQYNTEILPPTMTANLENVIPITTDNLPPLYTWALFAEVPAARGILPLSLTNRARFFSVTLFDRKRALETWPSPR